MHENIPMTYDMHVLLMSSNYVALEVFDRRNQGAECQTWLQVGLSQERLRLEDLEMPI